MTKLALMKLSRDFLDSSSSRRIQKLTSASLAKSPQLTVQESERPTMLGMLRPSLAGELGRCGRHAPHARIAKGPIPLDEALPIAKQIAEALEAAHEAGVIHSDLKPANIKVREDGTVKVRDLSPEQAAGRPVDKRSDIWSFGVVLFEMLTGQRLFAGACG